MTYIKVYNQNNPALHLKPDLDLLIEDIDSQYIKTKEVVDQRAKRSFNSGSSHEQINSLRDRLEVLKETFQAAKDERLQECGCFSILITWLKFIRPMNKKIKRAQSALTTLRRSFSIQDQLQRTDWRNLCSFVQDGFQKQMDRVAGALQRLRRTTHFEKQARKLDEEACKLVQMLSDLKDFKAPENLKNLYFPELMDKFSRDIVKINKKIVRFYDKFVLQA